ncbi:MAG: hypothetical protein AAGD32_07250 [Planctomycetota bacterium]
MTDPGLDRRLAWFVGVMFTVLSLLCALWSKGFVEADGVTHYMYARFAFEDPRLFVDVWGRPVVTLFHAPFAALGGLFVTRVASLLLVLACGWCAWRIAVELGHRRPVLAFAAVLASPLAFLHSFAVLTEVPFALLVGLMALSYLRRRWWVLALVVGLMPATRPEGFPLLIAVAVALTLHRQWLVLPLLAVPTFAWWLAARWLGMPLLWPYAETSLYPAGPVWHFVVCLPVIVGPAMIAPLIFGLRPQPSEDTHRSRSAWLITLLPLGVLVGHSVLYALGKMASNGELRYLLVMLPLWGVLAGRGWERIEQRAAWFGRPMTVAGATLLAPVIMVQPLYWPVLPIEASTQFVAAERIAAWYESVENPPPLLFSDPSVAHFLDVPIWPHAASKRAWAAAEPGTVMVVDPIYSRFNSTGRQTIGEAELELGEELHAPVALPEGYRFFRRLP